MMQKIITCKGKLVSDEQKGGYSMSYKTLHSMKEGVKNIWRNRMYSLALLGQLIVISFKDLLFFIGQFQIVIKSAESSVDITVFLKGIGQAKLMRLVRVSPREEVKSIGLFPGEETWLEI